MRRTKGTLKKVFIERYGEDAHIFAVIAVYKRPDKSCYGIHMLERPPGLELPRHFRLEVAARAKAENYARKKGWKGTIHVYDRISSLQLQAGMPAQPL